MRVLAVCESPPTLDPAEANGSTLIPAQVLPRLSADVEVDLLWFQDRAAPPDRAVLARCEVARALPLRPGRLALAAQAGTRLPRATWQRAGHSDLVRRLGARADVVYLHGLHVFGHAVAVAQAAPVVVQEVDPWSQYWRQRAHERRGPAAAYDASQARRAERLERQVAAVATEYLVVSHRDAEDLGRRLGRKVVAVPNGVERRAAEAAGASAEECDLLVFVGTLDYPPNVAAVHELATQVLPLVRRERPGARLLVAGRRPTDAVRALEGAAVQVVGAVDDVHEVFSRAAVAVYPGRLGRGTKNTPLEALAAGCPVVATPEAARGLPQGDHLLLGREPIELAAHVLALLADDGRRRALRRSAAAAVRDLPPWEETASRYEQLLRGAASSPLST